MIRRSVAAAISMAALLRRAGYPQAIAAPEYCIDGEIGPDGFFTETVCVFAGKHVPDQLPPTA